MKAILLNESVDATERSHGQLKEWHAFDKEGQWPSLLSADIKMSFGHEHVLRCFTRWN